MRPRPRYSDSRLPTARAVDRWSTVWALLAFACTQRTKRPVRAPGTRGYACPGASVASRRPARPLKSGDAPERDPSVVLEILRAARPPRRAELAADALRRSDAAFHQCRHEPVQGRVSRPRETRLQARNLVAEVHASQRQAQRSRYGRSVAAPSHVLRDARQLFLWRLFQAGRHSVCLDAADRRVGPGSEAALRHD